MDVLTSDQRHRCMAAVRGRDTLPELLLRRALHARGFRYRLGGAGLRGRPDIVFPGRRVAVFVHGCFWHRHACKAGRSLPLTHGPIWRGKLEENRRRDRDCIASLERSGWHVVVVWSCEMRAPGLDAVCSRVAAAFG
jgi:DNA mismatch endonuclease (patch repair protein)